jgi:hypothetical protein
MGGRIPLSPMSPDIHQNSGEIRYEDSALKL